MSAPQNVSPGILMHGGLLNPDELVPSPSPVTSSTLIDTSSELSDSYFGKLHDVNEYEHIVQFYDTQEFLLKVLVNFIAPIMGTSDAAVVIAVQTRLEALEMALQERGLPVEDKKRKGQLVMIEAQGMLDVLSSRGESSSFSVEHLEAIFQNLNKQFAKLYVYGELVDLLCGKGEHAAAVKLEEKWNDIVRRHRLTLLCGYNMNNFKEESLDEAFRAVCDTHSHVGSPEDLNDLDSQDSLLVIATLKQKAKVLETEIKRRKAVEDTLGHYLELLSTRAEESLRHQQELYRTLLSILPVGVYSAPMAIATPDSDHVFINQRFCELSGMTEERIRASGWFSAVHPEDRHRVRRLWDTSNPSLFGGKEEYRYVLSDKTIRWVTGETLQFTSHEGMAQTYVHTIVDITALKEVEKQRVQASQKAEELLRHRAEQAERHKRDQDQFIDTLCHELRNPLSSIHGNVELLQIGLDMRQSILSSDHISPQGLQRLRDQATCDQESIMAIEKCVAHQKVITDDVLNLSKIEVGKVVLRKVEFNPKDVVMEVTKVFVAEANRKGINLRCNLPVSDIIIRADPDRVSQVLINLVANALKFTTHGSITLELDIEKPRMGQTLVRITVKDTGIGLTTQEMAKLFHRFMQPTSTSYDDGTGSGLGLVISKGLVELMGGTMSVESTKGQGSEFIFTFVSDEEECRRCEWPATTLSPSRPHNVRSLRKVLVVEDNVINQRFLTRLLEFAGFECTTAGNGLEAFACVERESFDVILMDVHMPVMDGISSTRKIRAREAEFKLKPLPIIGLSGNAREEHLHEAISSGMNCYLTKPCRKEELYSVINRFNQTYAGE